jgi:regulator of sigma E protease
MILTIVSFIVVLGILVFVHEMGHYLAARHVGVRVDQFSIGFPPRLIGRKWGDTEYLISWVPLGGYVRLFGQNLDDENPRHPSNYAAKTVAQRLYILVAGPFANLFLALLVMPIVYMIGVESAGYRAEPPVLAGVESASPADRAGFREGDRIVRLAGQPIATWNDLFAQLESHAASSGSVAITVAREDGEAVLEVPLSAFATTGSFGWLPRIEPVAGRVAPGTPAGKAGLLPGDRILAVNDTPIHRWEEISREIQKSGGEAMRLTIQREGERLAIALAAEFNEGAKSWLIGISPPMQRERHGPIDAFVLGTARLWEITRMTFVFLGHLVTGKGSMDQIGGPVKIGAFIGEAARTSASSLAFLMAVISLQLGIFNLLPIPALDGGHIFYFLLPELVRGTPLKPKLRAQIQTVGMTLLILLMVFVTYNDILQLLS